MAYVALIHATFASQADADHIYDQALSVATNASVARIGEPGERTSHGVVIDEGTDTVLRQWHIDRFGIVRESALAPDDEVPDWSQPSGAQDAYPATDVFGNTTRVQHNGSVWENSHGDGNTWEPGAFGWTEVTT